MVVDEVVTGSSEVSSTAPESSGAEGTSAPQETASTEGSGAVTEETGSPVAKKAREALENARKGNFEVAKDKTQPASKTKTPPAAKTGETPVVEGQTAAQYTPNYKFKANHQEKEFDDFLKPLIKDAETEKKIRKLYEDAHGLEPVKAYAERMKQNFQEVNTKFTTLDKDLKLLSHHIKSDDFDSFFEGIGCDINRVFKWVEKKLSLMNATPEQQAEYERVRQLNKQNFELSQENTGFKSAQEMQAVQARTTELDMELMKPEVQSVAQAFDARVGRLGAFREECMNRGLLMWQRLQKDISAAEAVTQVMSLMGNVVPVQQAQGQPLQNGAQPGASNPSQNVVPPPRPVIPNVSGHATSPIKTAPRSIDDLRKLAKQSQGARA